MSLLIGLVNGFAGALLYLAAFLFVLSVVVFIHELGHFLVARWCGVKVQTFSIGFGKEVFGFYDRHGTRWRLSWIPLGGYVKFIDDENAASVPSADAQSQMSDEERRGAFHAKPLWARAAVVAAGPIANFLLAIVIFAGMFMFYGQVKMEPRVGKVIANTPAAVAGFKAGDLVRSINGRKVDDFSQLQQIVSTSPGRILTFVVERKGVLQTLDVKPVFREQNDRIAGRHQRPVIGIQASVRTAKITHEAVGPLTAVGLGVDRTATIITQTLSYIGDVFTLRQKPDQVGGLLRIADASGKVAQLGPEYVIQFIAFISVSVGLINLFPIPLLDGGHLMFYAFEAVRGRPLSDRSQEIGFRIGFALVIALMVFATWNDRGVVARWLDLNNPGKSIEKPLGNQ
ncbi:MAG: RIP metalloprotease RseP [Hyphomicrobiaceae bacterium]|nr:RIP metalloprotease RseP [Hyphomicrobiaceae bacterium]